MILHAANQNGRTIELFGDAAEIRVERVARDFVAQERPAVFGGEDQMNVNGGKGLGHSGRVVNPRLSANSNGIVSFSPTLRQHRYIGLRVKPIMFGCLRRSVRATSFSNLSSAFSSRSRLSGGR